MQMRPFAPLLLLALSSLAAGCLPATQSTIVSSSRVARTSSARESTSASAPTSASMSNAAEIDRRASDVSLNETRREILIQARDWLGTPYEFGGASSSGADCSGFVQSVFHTVGVQLPRTSGEQATVGLDVSLANARAGDLVFFNTTGSGVSHVGIMISATQFIHASTSRGVTVSSIDEPYYRERFLFVRRVLD